MLFKDLPIQRKLITVIMLTSGAVLFLTCTAFFAYEYHSFKQSTLRQLSTLGEIIASNSTAALAFDTPEDANEILNALKVEKHIVAAVLYDKNGNFFAKYPSNLKTTSFPEKPGIAGYQYINSSLEGFQPVIQGDRILGTLYLKSDLKAMYDRFKLYGLIVILVVVVSSIIVYFLSKILQRGISKPILELADVAKAISERHDYSVRAVKLGKDEIGSLTDAFNQMLIQIQLQNQSLNEFNQTLEQKVIERTKELQALNKELESFSYSISHDLRAPLRSINGYTKILEEEYVDKLDDEAKRVMNIISNNARKMGQLIDDILAFAKLGRKELMKDRVLMKRLVGDIWEEFNRIEEKRAIEFILKELPEIDADIATIKQVWINLISNALKYSKNREKTVIEIGFEEKKSEIIYYIKDNGDGFDMAYYDKLFGVFQRLHSDKEFEGTGVGLAIVQRIIIKHGGKVWAEGAVGKGATFYFVLPKHLELIQTYESTAKY